MIQGWEGRDLGRNKVEHICVRKRTWDFVLGGEQRFPVLATESMFNRYFQPSRRWIATSSLHTVTRANTPCLLAGATEQHFLPRPCYGKHQRSIQDIDAEQPSFSQARYQNVLTELIMLTTA
jgi:hypothetical protein